ncbi:MAG: hypothetical protein AAFX50_15990, partial [Acidobacteriota bacterium]
GALGICRDDGPAPALCGFRHVAAAKVFRVGILMTGKPPKLGEILRWIRVPVGTVAVRRDD